MIDGVGNLVWHSRLHATLSPTCSDESIMNFIMWFEEGMQIGGGLRRILLDSADNYILWLDFDKGLFIA